MLNGVGRGARENVEEVMESMETEEGEGEEEENLTLELPIATPSSEHQHQHQTYYLTTARGRECSPQHMQELQETGQFPMSGDLPSLDPGLPSPSLGFDLSEVR